MGDPLMDLDEVIKILFVGKKVAGGSSDDLRQVWLPALDGKVNRALSSHSRVPGYLTGEFL